MWSSRRFVWMHDGVIVSKGGVRFVVAAALLFDHGPIHRVSVHAGHGCHHHVSLSSLVLPHLRRVIAFCCRLVLLKTGRHPTCRVVSSQTTLFELAHEVDGLASFVEVPVVQCAEASVLLVQQFIFDCLSKARIRRAFEGRRSLSFSLG